MLKKELFDSELLDTVTYGTQMYSDVMSEVQYMTSRCDDLAARGRFAFLFM